MPTKKQSKNLKPSEKKPKKPSLEMNSTTGSSEKKEPTKPEEMPGIPSLDELEKEIEEEQGIGKESEKRPPGRPKGSKTKKKEEEAPPFDTDQSAKGLLKFISKLLASRIGKHWEMTPEEIETGSVAVSGMLEKYGKAFADYGVEAAFLMWGFGYVGTRLDLTKKHKVEVTHP